VPTAPRRLLVATRSRHKLRELRELLDVPPGVTLLSPEDVGIADEPEETGETFETNARIKARFYATRSGLPTLADDSGIEVDALGGGPGVRTRRYAGRDATDEANNAKLLRELAGLPAARRGARYVCVLALAMPGDAGPRGGLRLIARRGTCRGRIAVAAKGSGGFGYDPIFEPWSEPPGGATLGEWSAAAKHAISHRARAAARMAPVLRAVGFSRGRWAGPGGACALPAPAGTHCRSRCHSRHRSRGRAWHIVCRPGRSWQGVGANGSTPDGLRLPSWPARRPASDASADWRVPVLLPVWRRRHPSAADVASVITTLGDVRRPCASPLPAGAASPDGAPVAGDLEVPRPPPVRRRGLVEGLPIDRLDPVPRRGEGSPIATFRWAGTRGVAVKSQRVVSHLASDQLAMSSGWLASSIVVTASIAAMVSGRK
jgi:XTP/dITP diphosphohydrolase